MLSKVNSDDLLYDYVLEEILMLIAECKKSIGRLQFKRAVMKKEGKKWIFLTGRKQNVMDFLMVLTVVFGKAVIKLAGQLHIIKLDIKKTDCFFLEGSSFPLILYYLLSSLFGTRIILGAQFSEKTNNLNESRKKNFPNVFRGVR